MTKDELYKFMGSLSELTAVFHNSESDEKRVGRIITPTSESRAVLQDYISRWAWVIVQRGSDIEEAPEDMPQIVEADMALDFEGAVLEMVLYGIAYLFDYGTYGTTPIYAIESEDYLTDNSEE